MDKIDKLEKKIELLGEIVTIQSELLESHQVRQNNIDLLLISGFSRTIESANCSDDDKVYLLSLFESFYDAEKSHGAFKKKEFDHFQIKKKVSKMFKETE